MGWYLATLKMSDFSTITACENGKRWNVLFMVGIFYQCLFCFLLFPWSFLALEGRLSGVAVTMGAAERVWIVDSIILFSPIRTIKAFLLLPVASFCCCLSSCIHVNHLIARHWSCSLKELTSKLVGYLDSLFFKMSNMICLTSCVSLGFGSFCFSSIFSNSLGVEHKTCTCLC